MSARNLRLQVIMSAVDRVRRPLQKIREASGQTAEALRASQQQLRELNQQQKDLSGYRRTNIAIRGNTRALRDAQSQQHHYAQSLERQRTAHVGIKSSLTAARREYDTLARSVLNAREPNAALSNELERSRIRLARQQEAFDQSSRSIRTYRDRLRNADDKTKRLTETKRTLNERLHGLKTRLDQAGISTDNTSRKARELREQEDRLNTTLEQQRRQLERVADRQRQLNRARSQYQQGRAVAGSIAGAGGRMLGTGAIGGYATARFLGPGAQFDATMSRVQALARLEKDDPALAAIRAQARELGASTTFTSSEVGEGQAFLAMAGFNPDDIRAAIPGLLDLARAGDMDLGATADIASNILTSLKLPAEEMNRVADVMAGAFTRSNTSIASLGETMKYAAPSAAQFGVDLETVTAMAAKLGDAGLQGSMGGTGIRRVLSRLAAPTGEATAALESLGAEADEIAELGMGREALQKVGIQIADPETGGMRDTVEILKEIYEHSRNLSDIEQGKLWKDIAGETGAGVLSILVEQAGEGGLEELRSELFEAHENSEASNIARIMSDNFGGDWNQLKSAWQDVGVEVFTQLSDWLRETAQRLTEVVRRVKSWMEENPGLTQAIGKIIIVGTALMTVLGGISLAIAGFLGPLVLARFLLAQVGIRFGLVSLLSGKLGKSLLFVARGAVGLLLGSLKMMGAGLQGIGKGIAFLGGMLRALGAIALAVGKGIMAGLLGALKATGAFLLTNPIGWILMGIALIAFLVIKYWEPISEFFSELWKGVKDKGAKFWEWLKGIGPEAGRAVKDFFLNWTLPGLLVQHWDSIKNAGSELWRWFQEAPSNAVAAIANMLADWDLAGTLREKWDEAMDYLKDLPGRMREAGVDAARGLGEGIKNGANSAWQATRDFVVGTESVARYELDTHSPSRVFATIGQDVTAGLAQGLRKGAENPLSETQGMIQRIRQAGAALTVGALGLGVSAATADAIDLSGTPAPIFDDRPPLAAAAGNSISISIGDIHVHPSPGMDEQALARHVAAEVQRAVDRAARDADARRRSAFHDLD